MDKNISVVENQSPKESPRNTREVAQHWSRSSSVTFKTTSTLRLHILLEVLQLVCSALSLCKLTDTVMCKRGIGGFLRIVEMSVGWREGNPFYVFLVHGCST